MSFNKFTCNRPTYDAWQESRLREFFAGESGGIPAARVEEFEQTVERQYPRTRAQAVAELRFRGFAAKDHHLATTEGCPRFPRFGGEAAWYKSDIDAAAESLASSGKFMSDVLWRRDHGLTFKQALETDQPEIRLAAESVEITPAETDA